MTTPTKPRILCIDDEPNVLAGFQLNLRRDFDVLTASGGEQGLEILDRDPEIAVVVSDMRMPKMTGNVVLAKARERRPEVTRVLLTGQADMQSAISAINDGQIFRFLTKPCDREPLVFALKSAVEHHRLVTAERVLLRDTLNGAIAALVDILSLTTPVVFGRSNRIKARATRLAEVLKLPDPWQLAMAASLQHIGYVTLPAEAIDKLFAGHALSDDEQKMVARLPAVTEQLLAHIPRLDAVRGILAVAGRQATWHGTVGDAPSELAGAILRVASDADALEVAGTTNLAMVDVMRGRNTYDRRVLDALAELVSFLTPTIRIVELPLSKLRPKMVMAEDVKLMNNTLLVARGYEVTVSFLERVRNFPEGSIREPLRISMVVDDDRREGAISK